MKNKTLLFQAAPFCYGPISTTLGVVSALADCGYHVIVVNEGPCSDLIRRSGLSVESVEVSTLLPFSAELVEVLDRADLVVSNTDTVFAAAAVKHGAKVVVIDTLFWMWHEVDAILRDSSLYIVQEFFGIDDQMARLGWNRPLVRVGPLVRTQEPPWPLHDRKNSLLITFGGCDCTLVDPRADTYPALMLDLIEDVLQELPPRFGEILVTVGERTARILNSAGRSIRVSTLSNQEHLECIRQASAVLISPGLTGTMEVLEAETPVFFLPPQNYSQVLQLRAYRDAGVASFSFAWSDIYPEFGLECFLPEEDAVRRVRELVDRFAIDQSAMQSFRQCLRNFLSDGCDRFDPIPGRELRRSLGMRGCAEAARSIQRLLTVA